MNIVRKIKLRKLKFYTCNKKESKLLDFIENYFLNLKIIKLKRFSNHIFWFKNNKCIFEYNLKYNIFTVKYTKFWEIFNIHFNYNDDQTNKLIKDVIEDVYKLSIIQNSISIIPSSLIEHEYKLNNYSVILLKDIVK